jgi:tRNA(adenine34) deaminase
MENDIRNNMDENFMREALAEARKAYEINEVPIGAVIVRNGEIVGRGFNQKETLKDATLHAEISAIKDACKNLKGWRLPGCTMYVTLEPCSMCAGALVNARVERLVIGAKDFKTGACGSVLNIVQMDKLNHQISVEFGVLEEECSNILSDFFEKLRKSKKSKGESNGKISNA